MKTPPTHYDDDWQAGDLGVSPTEHAALRKERDELRKALTDAGKRLRSAGMLGVPGNDPVAAALANTEKETGWPP